MFTSFKLPKPGHNNSSSASNIGPATQQQLQGNEQPLLPTRFSSPTQGSYSSSSGILVQKNSDSHGGKILSAPLGGLPAMASQIEEAEEETSSKRYRETISYSM